MEELTYWTLAFPFRNYVEDNRTHLSFWHGYKFSLQWLKLRLQKKEEEFPYK